MKKNNVHTVSHENEAPSNRAVVIGSALGVIATAGLVVLAAHHGDASPKDNVATHLTSPNNKLPNGTHLVTEQIDFGPQDPENNTYGSMWEAAKHVRNMEGKSTKTDLRPIVDELAKDALLQGVAPRPNDPSFVVGDETITVTYPAPDQPK